MKRLILIASLCVAGLVVTPIASASAAEPEFKGTCKIHGAAAFGSPGLGLLLKTDTYSFKSTESPATPEEESICIDANGSHKVKATVSGSGELACAVAKGGRVIVEGSGSGTGTLEVNGEVVNFRLAFVAAAGNVVLDISKEEGGPPTATGDAEFLTPEGAAKGKLVAECQAGVVTSLAFEAAVAGTI